MLLEAGKAAIKDIGTKGVKSGLISVIGGLTCMAANAIFTGVASIFKKKYALEDIDMEPIDLDESENEVEVDKDSMTIEETEVEV